MFATVLPGSSFRESLQHEYNLVEEGMELTLVRRRRGWVAGGSLFESRSEVRSAANFPSASEFAMLGLNSLGPRGGGRFLLAFAKNSLRGHLPPSHVYTPLTSRGDFRAINAGGGGGKEIFGGLTSNAEEKGRERELRG